MGWGSFDWILVYLFCLIIDRIGGVRILVVFLLFWLVFLGVDVLEWDMNWILVLMWSLGGNLVDGFFILVFGMEWDYVVILFKLKYGCWIKLWILNLWVGWIVVWRGGRGIVFLYDCGMWLLGCVLILFRLLILLGGMVLGLLFFWLCLFIVGVIFDKVICLVVWVFYIGLVVFFELFVLFGFCWVFIVLWNGVFVKEILWLGFCGLVIGWRGVIDVIREWCFFSLLGVSVM